MSGEKKFYTVFYRSVGSDKLSGSIDSGKTYFNPLEAEQRAKEKAQSATTNNTQTEYVVVEAYAVYRPAKPVPPPVEMVNLV